MKIFIVFLALIMVFSCLCIHSNDMARYKELNTKLKVLSEDAALGAGLLTGRTLEPSIGILESDAQKFVRFVTSDAAVYFDETYGGNLSCSFSIVRPGSGYDKTSGPAITVTMKFTPSSPIFHLFKGPSYPITQTSTYEWIEVQ